MTVADLIMVLQQHDPTDKIKFVVQEPNALRYAGIDRVVREDRTVFLMGNLAFMEALSGSA